MKQMTLNLGNTAELPSLHRALYDPRPHRSTDTASKIPLISEIPQKGQTEISRCDVCRVG